MLFIILKNSIKSTIIVESMPGFFLLTVFSGCFKISYGISVGCLEPVKRETGANPVRCRRCKRMFGSLDSLLSIFIIAEMGRKQTILPRKPEDLLISAFAVTVHDKARETRVKSILDANTVHHPSCFYRTGGAFLRFLSVASRSCMGVRKQHFSFFNIRRNLL